MRGLLPLTLVQAKLFLREPPAVFFTLAFPTLLLLLLGAIFGNEPQPWLGSDRRYVDTAAPVLTALVVATLALMGIPIEVATSRETKVLRRYRATPMRPAVYIGATVLVSLVMIAAGFVLLLLTGWLVYGLAMPSDPAGFAAGLILSSASFVSLGFLVASLAPTARAAQITGTVIFFPLMFLSGAAVPPVFFPPGVKRVSEALPLTHAVELLQAAWAGRGLGSELVPLLALAGLLVVSCCLAARFFRWE